ncbi:hypothetical protein [Oceaniradius stylonematis]|uniref:hypothetical protein n=1 Tax=Oceaniradius stylonematis TaxID=2184161 RepID=UPI0035CEAF51
MRDALDNEFLRLFFTQATILWVIDRVGDCYLGIEETLPGFHEVGANDYSAVERFASQRFSPDSLRHEKIGHPALVGCDWARIGGELLLDGDDSLGWHWVINAKSGRYGKGRSEENLENAKSMIEKLGVNLNVGN